MCDCVRVIFESSLPHELLIWKAEVASPCYEVGATGTGSGGTEFSSIYGQSPEHQKFKVKQL